MLEGLRARGSPCSRVSMLEGLRARGSPCSRVSVLEGLHARGSPCSRVVSMSVSSADMLADDHHAVEL